MDNHQKLLNNFVELQMLFFFFYQVFFHHLSTGFGPISKVLDISDLPDATIFLSFINGTLCLNGLSYFFPNS